MRNTTGAPSANLSDNRDDRFLVCFPADNACFPAPDVGFVYLDIALQEVSTRSHHGSAKLMKPRPGRLVAAEAEYPL